MDTVPDTAGLKPCALRADHPLPLAGVILQSYARTRSKRDPKELILNAALLCREMF